MSGGVKTPVLSTTEAIARLQKSAHPKAVHFYALYSSLLGGIVTDPALMVLPIDDHMVHRGHGVFDTTTLANGMLYQLDDHLDRFIGSAEIARIPLPFPRNKLRQIILDTAAVGGQRNGALRFWLSAGPGGFSLDPSECIQSGFYVMHSKGEIYPQTFYAEGVKVVTSTVPMKPPLFARVKSINYLPNVLAMLEAKERGAHYGILIDQRGMVGESSTMNVAFITMDRVFRHPPFDSILSGITVQRLFQLAKRLVDQGQLKDIVISEISPEEGKSAAEMLLIGSTIKVVPVVQWDEHPIGDGKPGPIAKKLLELWYEDIKSSSQHLVKVPYSNS